LLTRRTARRGIYLWANRLVYSASGEAELAPPPADGAAPLEVRAPGVGDGSALGRGSRGWGARGDGDDSDAGSGSDADEDDAAPAGVASLVEAEGEAGVENGTAPPLGPTTLALPPLPQVAPRMATLALLPRAQWMALLHLDTLRERGKPLAPPKKPETAPFFLPTLASLAPHPVFDTAASGEGDAAPKGGSRVLRGGAGGASAAVRSPLMRAIAAGAASSPPDYSAAVAHLAASGPSALDAELRSLTLASPDGASLTDDDAASLAALLDFFAAELPAGRAFELLHAALAATLRVHGEALTAHPMLRERAAGLRDAASGAWGRLDRRFQQARCVLAFLAGLGQA
jgi:U3 small nucleolar RNA-associated protein 21